MSNISFRIRQDGVTVARCDGPHAKDEILVYAAQYREDGEVTIQHNGEGHWKRYAVLCQWPSRKNGRGTND